MEGRNLLESGVLHQYGNVRRNKITRRGKGGRRWVIVVVTLLLALTMVVLGSKIVHSNNSNKQLGRETPINAE